jgi:hypothetical protein
MTLLTVRSELTPVQIGVALRAASGRIRKDQTHMAALAGNIAVQTLQRKTGLPGMIELWLTADRFPGGRGVAVFAGNLQSAMWIRRPAAN